MKTDNNKFIYWSPRILSIFFVLFLMLFSLDVFGQGNTLSETVIAFLMHNIPSFILAFVVVLSWKYEIIGAVCFLAAGLLYLALAISSGENVLMKFVWSIQISGPAFYIAIMYWLNWKYKSKYNKDIKQLNLTYLLLCIFTVKPKQSAKERTFQCRYTRTERFFLRIDGFFYQKG